MTNDVSHPQTSVIMADIWYYVESIGLLAQKLLNYLAF